jgi:beta-carotene hydroxylase
MMERSIISGDKRWKKQHIYWLSRTLVLLVLALALGTFFWTPEGSLQWGADIVFRTWLMFLGTVMAHECTHGLLSESKRGNAIWGRLALIPVTVPYVNFRKTHLMHHSHTNHPENDPDYFVKANHWWEMPFRAVGVPHNWIVWLLKRGMVKRSDVVEWIVTYLFMFSLYLAIGSEAGIARTAWGLFPSLVLVSMFLWYPFASMTHEGYSLGEAQYRSHNYYGAVVFWATLGLSMHRIHHMKPYLSWIEQRQFVEPDPAGFWVFKPRRDRRIEPQSA